MRLKRGCGCPLLILAVLDIALTVLSLISIIVGPSDEPVQGTRGGIAIFLALFGANAIAVGLLALTALRRPPEEPSSADTYGTTYEEGEESEKSGQTPESDSEEED